MRRVNRAALFSLARAIERCCERRCERTTMVSSFPTRRGNVNEEEEEKKTLREDTERRHRSSTTTTSSVVCCDVLARNVRFYATFAAQNDDDDDEDDEDDEDEEDHDVNVDDDNGPSSLLLNNSFASSLGRLSGQAPTPTQIPSTSIICWMLAAICATTTRASCLHVLLASSGSIGHTFSKRKSTTPS